MIGFKRYFIVGTNDSCLHGTMNGAVTGELIRCKDCKYYYVLNEVRGNCSEYNFVGKIPSDFCSWAERKEHGNDV